MSKEMGFHIIDATQSIEEQQRQMREIVINSLGDSLRNGVLQTSAGRRGVPCANHRLSGL